MAVLAVCALWISSYVTHAVVCKIKEELVLLFIVTPHTGMSDELLWLPLCQEFKTWTPLLAETREVLSSLL